MAQRRMVSVKIIDSAKFIKMPASTQALYFHLLARADDDGIVEAFNVMRMTGSAEDDLKVLTAKEFVKVLNEDLVAYITDWHEHNLIRADRKVDSIYQSLLLQIVGDVEIKEKKERADRRKNVLQLTDGTSHGPSLDRIGKDSIGKVSEVKDKKTPTDASRFDEIYNLFYKKKVKADALKSYTKLLKSYTHEQLLQAAVNYNNTPQSKGEYAYQPNNFFGQKEYFKDYLKTQKPVDQLTVDDIPSNYHPFERERGMTQEDYDRGRLYAYKNGVPG